MNQKPPGQMLIVIEGLDGSGKSTQVKKLRTHLERLYGDVNYIHFPRYGAPVYGDLISRFLKGEFGGNDQVHPQLVALLFAEDRHYALPQMAQTLEKGGCVLLDRYVYSNVAYQCAKLKEPQERERLRKWINDTEYGVFNLPRPDLNIFLDVPIGFVERKLASHRQGNDRDYLEGGQDIHEADINFQKAVRDMYLGQCALDPDFIRIDCSGDDGEMLPPDVIFRKITDAMGGK
ncbi:MAG: dTMP kinase [Candidatus Cryptobacteroides sp.]